MAHRRFAFFVALVLVTACGDGSTETAVAPDPGDNPTPPPPKAVELAFRTTSRFSYTNEEFEYAIQVVAKLESGAQALGYTGTVSISLDGNTTPGTLIGTTTVSARQGVATFPDLRISEAGDYRLRATADGLRAAVSDAITIRRRPLPLGTLAYASCLEWGWDAAFEDVCVSSGFTISKPDGSETVLAIAGPSIDGDPTWSPDGRRLAFTGYRHCDGAPGAPCVSEIYTMFADGLGVRRLTNLASNGASWGPSWSPDGTRIAFSLWTGKEALLYVVSEGGGTVARLGNLTGNSPAWSPDGSKIAFASDDRGRFAIFIANADGSNPIRVTDPMSLAGDPANDYQPAWSPDGRRIAFTRGRSHPAGNGSCQVFVMGADGSNPVQLTNDYFCAHAAAWSPDGTKISYNGIDGSQPGMSGIKLMNADGSQDVLLRRTSGWPSRVAWAPQPAK